MKYINAIIFKIRKVSRVNFLKTFVFNFRCFSFAQAIHLPVLLYGKVVIHDLSGKVEIKAPLRYGMIKVGYKWLDLFPTSILPTQLLISGKLVFEGRCIISGGVGLFVQHKDASLVIGDEVSIGGGTLVKSVDVLEIGKRTSITGNCVIMNSNMHVVKNIDTGAVKKPWGPIIIGESCWINAGCVVNKGAIIPNYSISARNSFLNKDYSEFGENLFLVGCPAKVSATHVQRIFGMKRENELKQLFRTRKEQETIILEPGLEIDRGGRFNN